MVRACFEHILAREDGQIPKDLHLLLKQIVLRFAPTFDAIRAEMMITNNEALARFLDQCEIAEHEIGILSFEDKKKRRLRSDHSRNYENETIQDESASKEVPGDPKILVKVVCRGRRGKGLLENRGQTEKLTRGR